MWIIQLATPISDYQPIRLQHTMFSFKFTNRKTNSLDSEAIWSVSTLFAKVGVVVNSRIRVKFGAEIFHFYTNFCLKINSFCQPELFHIFIPQSRQNFFKKSPINLRIKKIWAYLCVKDFYTAIIHIFHSPIFVTKSDMQTVQT